MTRHYPIAIAIVLVTLIAFAITPRAHDGDHGPSQGAIEAINGALRNVDTKLTGTSALLAQLTDPQPGGGKAAARRMTVALQPMVEEMKRLRLTTNGTATDAGLHADNRAMAALEKAARDLDKMASALQSMVKNIAQMDKAARQTAQR